MRISVWLLAVIIASAGPLGRGGRVQLDTGLLELIEQFADVLETA